MQIMNQNEQQQNVKLEDNSNKLQEKEMDRQNVGEDAQKDINAEKVELKPTFNQALSKLKEKIQAFEQNEKNKELITECIKMIDSNLFADETMKQATAEKKAVQFSAGTLLFSLKIQQKSFQKLMKACKEEDPKLLEICGLTEAVVQEYSGFMKEFALNNSTGNPIPQNFKTLFVLVIVIIGVVVYYFPKL